MCFRVHILTSMFRYKMAFLTVNTHYRKKNIKHFENIYLHNLKSHL